MTAKKKRKAKLPKQLIEKFAREQRLNVAAHEAGHLVVGAIQGFVASAEIWKDNKVNPAREKMWQGTAGCLGHQSAEVAVAGTVAEQLFRNPDANVEKCLALFYDDYEAGEMSDSDLRHIPTTYEELDIVVGSVYKLLRKNWRFFEWARNKLLNDEFIDSQEVEDYCPEHKVKRIPHPSAQLSIEIRRATEVWRALPPEERMPPSARSSKGVKKAKPASQPKSAKKKPKAKPATTAKTKRRKTK